MYKAGELNKNQLDCFIEPREAEELYDVKNDPYQFNNLAQNPEYGQTLKEMQQLLDSWINDFDDLSKEDLTAIKKHCSLMKYKPTISILMPTKGFPWRSITCPDSSMAWPDSSAFCRTRLLLTGMGAAG